GYAPSTVSTTTSSTASESAAPLDQGYSLANLLPSAAMHGYLLKVGSGDPPARKRRYFVLTSDGRLFLFRSGPGTGDPAHTQQQQLPVTFLPLRTVQLDHSADAAAAPRIVVHGSGTDAGSGNLVQRTWTLECADGTEARAWLRRLEATARLAAVLSSVPPPPPAATPAGSALLVATAAALASL
ncbi:hypothetical protein HK405_000104, partial [Cladochytrium tenue]